MCRLRPGEGRIESQAAELGEETDSKRALSGTNEWSKRSVKSARNPLAPIAADTI